MISVLIHAPRREPALAVTMARLVEGVVAGLVRDAVLVDLAGDDLAGRLAEEAGCRLIRPQAGRDGLAEALSALRGDWVLLIPAGLAPEPVWTRRIGECLALAAAGGETKGGALLPARPGRDLRPWERVAATLGFARPRRAILCQRETLRALPAGPDLFDSAEKAVRGAGRAMLIRDAMTDFAA